MKFLEHSAKYTNTNSKPNDFCIQTFPGSGSGYASTTSQNALNELHKLTLTRQPPYEKFMFNICQLAKLGSYKIFKGKLSRSWHANYLYPDSGNRVFNATKRNILNRYVYPLARAGGCIVAIIFLIFLFYLFCLFLQWCWLMLTGQIVAILVLATIAGCLQMFRPWLFCQKLVKSFLVAIIFISVRKKRFLLPTYPLPFIFVNHFQILPTCHSM